MRDQSFCIVYSGSIVEVDLLKGLLEGEGINALLQDEFIGTIAPYAAAAGGAGAIKVLVARADLDRAEAIIERFVKPSRD